MKFLSLAVAGLMTMMADGSRMATRGAARHLENNNNNGNYNQGNNQNNGNNNNNNQNNGQNNQNQNQQYQNDADNENYDYQMEQQDNFYADVYPVSSNNKFKFSQCVSLTVQNDNLLMDNIVGYAADGIITAVRSFILFDMCEKDNCSRNQNNPMASTFMVDLDTYLDNMVEYAAEEDLGEYCNACETYSSDCGINNGNNNNNGYDQYAEGAEGEQNGQNGNNGNNGGRRLQNNNYNYYNNGNNGNNGNNNGNNGNNNNGNNGNNGNVKPIDCNKCYAAGCFDDYVMEQQQNQQYQYYGENGEQENQNQDQDMDINAEEVAEWVDEISTCTFTNTYWQNIGLYAGWLCNADGTGVQVGLFLDNQCRMYHSQLSYANVADQDTYWTMLGAAKIIPAMFATTVDCADDGDQDVTYVSKYEYQMYMQNNNNGNNNNNNNNNNNGNNNQAQQQQVQYDDEGNAIYGYYDQNGDFVEYDGNQQNQQQDGGDASELCQAIFDGDNFKAKSIGNCGDEVGYQDYNNAANGNYYHYDWYQYDMSRTTGWDQSAICNTMAQKFINGELTQSNVIDEEGSGAFFNYTDYTTYDQFDESDAYLFEDSEGEAKWWSSGSDGKGGAKYSKNGGWTGKSASKMAPWAILLIVIIVVGALMAATVRTQKLLDSKFCCKM